MYYNRILRVWTFDQLDCFLLGAIVGSLLASQTKKYLSEKKAMERLKSSIINKSNLLIKPKTTILNSKKTRKKTIYRFSLDNRGGQLENFQADHELSNEAFKYAQEIKGLVERLASYLKKRELQAVAKIFFKNGRLILELLLYTCKINVSYAFLTEGLNVQVIVITATAGGAAGFILSWFKVGASLVAPPVLFSFLFIRSFAQQIFHQKDYLNFKKLVNQMLDDDQLKQTIKAVFMEGAFKKKKKWKPRNGSKI